MVNTYYVCEGCGVESPSLDGWLELYLNPSKGSDLKILAHIKGERTVLVGEGNHHWCSTQCLVKVIEDEIRNPTNFLKRYE